MTRGEYLVRASGCFSCHTVAGGEKLAGGRALAIPFGTFYSPNITPDPDTGLRSSAWSEAAFLKAMKTGKHIGTGRDILLPMPWFMYKDLSDEDLRAIWAYLQSIPPVKNEVPDPIPPPGAKK